MEAEWTEDEVNPWVQSSHTTGDAIGTGGIFGQPYEVHHRSYVVCGRSFVTVKEEITIGYLQSTHIEGETYRVRMARRNAF